MRDKRSLIALNSIALIGMAGVGKSTIGAELATQMQLSFIDSDDRIREMYHSTLRAIIESEGLTQFRQKEAAAICSIRPLPSIIATGGSAVYEPAAVKHLRNFCILVWLQTDPETIRSRIENPALRGIASHPSQSIDEIMKEREPLYKKYADLTVDCDSLSVQTLASSIQKKIKHLQQKA